METVTREPMTWQQIKLRHLKVKIKSLAAEARIIRAMEGKTSDNYCRNSLRLHRIEDVREEARHSQLAYAYLRKRPYSKAEKKGSRQVNQVKLAKLIDRFGGKHQQSLVNWLRTT